MVATYIKINAAKILSSSWVLYENYEYIHIESFIMNHNSGLIGIVNCKILIDPKHYITSYAFITVCYIPSYKHKYNVIL